MEIALQKILYASEVKMIRKKLKMKQKELAALMNVSVKTVEHWGEQRGQCIRRSGGDALRTAGTPVASGRTGDPEKRVPTPAQIYEWKQAVYGNRCE